MKLLHTADWHLGHTLHGVARDYEHARFLAWLLDRLEEREIDALVVAGDIFDSANPPASAQAALYAFLRKARHRRPGLDVVLVAGNHDSGSRLAAPSPILEALGVHVTGGLPRLPEDPRVIDWPPLCVPLHDSTGAVAAWCGAMPFLRQADLPVGTGEDAAGGSLVAGVAERYAGLVTALRKANPTGLPWLLTGHCYMRGGAISRLSERQIQRGNQHALPVGIFPRDVAYVALGHLHLAQAVAGDGRIRYSGSPIPLALDEADYAHQVLEVDIDADSRLRVAALAVPRAVEILRVPPTGPGDLDAVLAALAALELEDALPAAAHPFLEVRVRLERPEPGLRVRIEEVLAGRPVRLLKIATTYPGAGGALADAMPAVELAALSPEAVFARRYVQRHGTAPGERLVAAFHELLAAVGERD